MRVFFSILALSLMLFSCGSGNMGTKNNVPNSPLPNDTLRIANDSLQYEIIIVEPGFDSWLVAQPPRGYYSQSFLETKNRFFVSEFNIRVTQPERYSPALYSERINYDPSVDYGYEVNYLLYNYFMYFQEHFNQKL